MSDIRGVRLQKMNDLLAKGVYPYGGRFEVSGRAQSYLDDFKEGAGVKLAGRIIAVRKHGKSIFADMRDETAKMQLFINPQCCGDNYFDLFVNYIDIGDIIGITGGLFKTRMGEPSVKVTAITVLSKSLNPLPEKWHGLKDVETRYRRRYLDLIANHEIKGVFRTRCEVIKSIRAILDGDGYLEVETPMMQPIPGGAAGKPFKTRHEALDMDLYLRIAPELYLKRLLVGGFEKVYEINKSFRNEGISIRHNPEFTMLEVYAAYSDCRGMMELTQKLITQTAEKVIGKKVLTYQGREIDLNKWEVISFAEVMENTYGILPDDDAKAWIKKLKAKKVEIESENVSRTQVANIIADLLAPNADHPVFVIDLFADLCPLAKTKPGNPLLTDRFELFMGGMEIANAYSELNDPVEQRKRFLAQIEQDPKKRTAADLLDEDFIRALEQGMPPAGGLGIGIDRLVMIFTDSPSIRDVILFPQLRGAENGENLAYSG